MRELIPDSKWIPEPNSGCWLWLGNTNSNGYGKIWIKPKYHGAHRAMWVQHYGAIPEGMHVLHHCDTPLCVNPEHLFLGTNADNVADKVSKSRCLKGDGMPQSKLTEAEVLRIKTEIGSNREIGKKYGIDKSQVSRIRSGKVWRYLW